MEEKSVTEETLRACRWEDSIKVGLKETWYKDVSSIRMAKERI
jgi:hypothetical protein